MTRLELVLAEPLPKGAAVDGRAGWGSGGTVPAAWSVLFAVSAQLWSRARCVYREFIAAEAAAAAHGLAAARGRWRRRADGGGDAAALLLCCCGMPHGCDWPAPRRVSSARRSDRGQRNSPGLNAQPGAPARAGASHGACNASECSPRLAQMRPSSQPTVHRLLKKHSDECGTGDVWQAGHDAVIGCCVPSE